MLYLKNAYNIGDKGIFLKKASQGNQAETDSHSRIVGCSKIDQISLHIGIYTFSRTQNRTALHRPASRVRPPFILTPTADYLVFPILSPYSP